jgi:hypothetical protein
LFRGIVNPKAKFWEDSDLLAGSALTLKQRQQLKEEKYAAVLNTIK